jgi:folate-binding protein YgfZ
MSMSSVTAERPRAFVRVEGPQAADFLNRMVSNDMLALEVGDVCDALLLTAKGRVVATLRVMRRGPDDFLLLTEPGLGDVVRDQLLRARFAARCAIETEAHTSTLVLGEGAAPPPGAIAIPTADYGLPGWEVLDGGLEATIGPDELERMRIEAGTPLAGKDVDDRVLPAEAGLTERAVSFTKGCYPGQEPIARLHYRGHANRALRVLHIDSGEPPEADAEIVYEGRAVGRVTSATRANGGVVALGYVRSEVPEDALLGVNGAAARMRAPTRP